MPARQGFLTKPQGNLGKLEAISVQLAGITDIVPASVAHEAVIVMAGDHGVVRNGVSAFPAEVTPRMVLNFLAGGAAINVLARPGQPRRGRSGCGRGLRFRRCAGADSAQSGLWHSRSLRSPAAAAEQSREGAASGRGCGVRELTPGSIW